MPEPPPPTAKPGPPPYKELICTVGADAILDIMYPEDGLCDYLYYTELIVVGTLATPWQDKGWLAFQTQLKSRSKTAGGIAFDIHYVTPERLAEDKIVDELGRLSEENVEHYGLLNVVAHHSALVALMQKAQTLLAVMKGIQVSHQQAGKTILAMGVHDYGNPISWTTFKDQFKKAVNFQVDTVIAISSSRYSETGLDCKALPVSAISSDDLSYPSLKRLGELVKEDFKYDKSSAVVGLSYQLGVLTYQLEQEADDANKIAYSKCVGKGLGDQEILCDNKNKDLAFGRVGYIAESDKKHVYIGEIPKTATEKSDYIKSIGVRKRFSWLVFNVHLTITVPDQKTKKCVMPFEVLKAIRAGLDGY